MKNAYEVRGDITVIFAETNKGIVEVLIDTEDLPKVQKFPNTFSAKWNRKTKSYYVSGRVTVSYKKIKTVLIHRLILEAKDGMVVDHINHNPLDNRRCNIREVTYAQNNQNKKSAHRNSRTGVRGVHWHKSNSCYEVNVGNGKGRNIYIGSFRDLEEAEKAAIEARNKYMPYSQEKMSS